MHELSITESLLEIVLRHADGRRVVSVNLLIGELSTFVDESIEMYWNEISKGTAAEGARLKFRREAGALFCLDCQREFSIHTPEFLCPACGSARSRLARGQDCYVESIEVEEGSP
jgi:hydrogenase nickel incorporation protein HypA/HybF